MGRLDWRLSENRVFCVDPNDSHGVVNGMPLTPDYTDYCIWCNLIVEKVSRFKNQVNGTDITSSYYVSYGLNSSGENEYVSFMSGADPKHGYNFITTDYSDIDFNTVKKRNTIEGLQIDSIKISLQNFNCPMVVIKFTDIRGSGFFGREEATHNEYGKLNGLEVDENGEPIENIFGSFATIPYPRFKLQIKGFYGTPVTYQLTCSGFDGSFNSSTGNFDITVRFIGYEYGVLGDIPFSYIVAAPLTKSGSAYWEKHAQSKAWALPSGNNTNESITASDPPVTLVDFYNSIETALDRYKSEDVDINDTVLDEMYSDFINSYTARDNLLREVQLKLNELKTHITNEFGKDNIVCVDNTDTDVIIIFSESGTLKCSRDLIDLRNKYADKVYEYLTDYPDDENMFDTTIIPGSSDDGQWDDWTNTTIECSEFINYSTQQPTEGATIGTQTVALHPNAVVETASKDGSRIPINNINACYKSNILYFNEKRNFTLNKSISKALYEAFGMESLPTAKRWAFSGSTGYKKYAVVIDFKNAAQKISDTLTFLNLKYREYLNIANEKDNTTISKLIGFAPYISNYFKTVMCHIETLVHLFNETADKIYGQIQNNEREPRKLGVYNLQLETDVPGQTFKQIPPFPAVYKTKETEFETDTRIRTGENIVQTSWVGDFVGDTEWAEVELVEEIVSGLKEVWDDASKSSANKREPENDKIIPNRCFIPIDYVSTNPPNYMSQLTVSDDSSGPDALAYYAANRAELLFGVFDQSGHQDTSLYEAIGAMDAYRILSSDCDSEKLFDGLEEGQDMADEIIEITMCKNDGTGHEGTRDFELVDTGASRHPILTESEESEEDEEVMEYKYITTDNGTPIIPTDNFEKFNELKKHYVYSDGKWRVENLYSDSYVFTDNTYDFIAGQQETAGSGNSADDDETDPGDNTQVPDATVLNNYTNKSMFHIITDQNECEEIVKQTSQLSGNVNYLGGYNTQIFNKIRNKYILSTLNYEKYKQQNYEGMRNGYNEIGINQNQLMTTDGTIPQELLAMNAEETHTFIKNFTDSVNSQCALNN